MPPLSGDRPIRGFTKLLIGKSTRWGQILRQPWAQELPFPRLSDRDATGQPDEPAQPWQEPWSLTDTAIDPDLRCLTLDHELSYGDQWPVGLADEAAWQSALGLPRATGSGPTLWDQVAGAWIPTNPAGYDDTIWLSTSQPLFGTEAYPLGGLSTVKMSDAWEAEPTFSLLFYRWSPFGTRTGANPFRPYVEVRIGDTGDPTSGIVVYIPTRAPRRETQERGAPQVQVFHAGNGRLLAAFDQASLARRQTDATPQLEVLQFRSFEPGIYTVAISGVETSAKIVATDLVLDKARVQVAVTGSHMAFTFWPWLFGDLSGEGTAEKSVPGVWPSWVGAENGELVVQSHEPASTSITTEMQEVNIDSQDPNEPATTQPKLTLATTNMFRTPVVWQVTERHPATRGPAVTEGIDYADQFQRWEVSELPDGRASFAQYYPAAKDVALPDLVGNEWAECHLGVQVYGTTLAEDEARLVKVLEGPVSIVETARGQGRLKGKAQTILHVGTWLDRFQDSEGPKKVMAHYAGVSFQNWLVTDAVEYLLDGAGVPSSQVSWGSIDSSVLDELRIPQARPWRRDYAYGFGRDGKAHGVVEALTDLLASVSLRFRLTRDGEFEAFFAGGYSGTPDHVIEDDGQTFLGMVGAAKADLRSPGRRNVTLHIGADATGQAVFGLAADGSSIYDPASPHYLGDDWWSASYDPSNGSAEVTAAAELERRSRFQALIQWEWYGHPEWKVGDTVLLDYAGLRVPQGSVLEIVEKHSVGNATRLTYRETVTAGVVQTP